MAMSLSPFEDRIHQTLWILEQPHSCTYYILLTAQARSAKLTYMNTLLKLSNEENGYITQLLPHVQNAILPVPGFSPTRFVAWFLWGPE